MRYEHFTILQLSEKFMIWFNIHSQLSNHSTKQNKEMKSYIITARLLFRAQEIRGAIGKRTWPLGRCDPRLECHSCEFESK